MPLDDVLGKKPAISARKVDAAQPSAPSSSSGDGPEVHTLRGVGGLIRNSGFKLQAADLSSIVDEESALAVADEGITSWMVTGDKGSSKTTAPIGLRNDPRLVKLREKGERTKTVVLGFDRTTKKSIVQAFGPALRNMDIVIWDMINPQHAPNGDIVYPGYDPNQKGTTKEIIGHTGAILADLKDEPPSILVVDHFQALYEDLGNSFAYDEANKGQGIDPLGKVATQDWSKRSAVMKLIYNGLFTIPRDHLVCTGYGPREKVVITEDADGKRTDHKEVVVPRWMQEWQRDFLVVTHHTWKLDRAFGPQVPGFGTKTFWAQIIDSRTPRVPLGLSLELTGTGLDAFLRQKPVFSYLKEVATP